MKKPKEAEIIEKKKVGLVKPEEKITPINERDENSALSIVKNRAQTLWIDEIRD